MKYYYFIICEDRADNRGVIYTEYEIIPVCSDSLLKAKKEMKEKLSCYNADDYHHWRLYNTKAYNTEAAARSAIEK